MINPLYRTYTSLFHLIKQVKVENYTSLGDNVDFYDTAVLSKKPILSSDNLIYVDVILL